MKLRPRLALTVLGVLAPTMLALVWFDRIARHGAAEQILLRVASTRIESSREACEAAPESWGGHLLPPPYDGRGPRRSSDDGLPKDDRDLRPPPRSLPPGPPPWAPDERPPAPPLGPGPNHAPAEMFAYDEALRSRNPRAPILPLALAQAARSGGRASGSSAWSSEVTVLLRTPWGTGPCAFVLGRGTTDPNWGRILPDTKMWLGPMLLVFAAVLVAVGPVVRRIRRLEASVQGSARVDYAAPVTIDGRDEIADLARAFDTARSAVRTLAEESERRRQVLSEFVANTTHDVAIPLTVLLGHLAALRDELAKQASSEPAALVRSAMNEAHYLAALVENLTVAARLDDDSPPPRMPVDLGQLVARVVARHAPIARELGISLDSAVPAEPILVSADVTLLEQAASNVTYNAVRYNHRGGHVAIVLERRGTSGFALRVIDDGPGMIPEEIERALERGVRGDAARTRAPDGQGLGLHIVKRAAEAHGLRLTLARSEYGGLEVVLEGVSDAPER